MALSTNLTWEEMHLDPKLQEAIKDCRWRKPTLVQQTAIPELLKGRDLAVESGTGTGKTAAFVLPLLQRVVEERRRCKNRAPALPIALVISPSMELCQQSTEVLSSLSKYLKPCVKVDNLSESRNSIITDQRLQQSEVVFATCAAFAKAIRTQSLSANGVANLKVVVLDEADLVVSMATDSLRRLQGVLPSGLQVVLMSATLSEGVIAVKGQMMKTPTTIRLQTQQTTAPHSNEPLVTLVDTGKKALKQRYLIATDDCHEQTLIYALYRLNLISGKTLIFVPEEDDTYRMQHFLEQLSINSVVYDGHLPTASRMEMLNRFQRGAVNSLICTDGTLKRIEDEQLDASADDIAEKKEQARGGKKGRTEGGEPSALHRGVDFAEVRNVIILGMENPTSLTFSKYVHRVGRTARAGSEGLSILILSVPQARSVLTPLRSFLKNRGETIRPFKDMQRSEAAKLQYRVDSALTTVTRSGSKKLRIATVAAEIARSQYLATHLTPRDSEALEKVVRRGSRVVRHSNALLQVPRYMHLKDADDVSAFRQRVRARESSSKQDTFHQVMSARKVDPLQKIVEKVTRRKSA